MNMRALCIQRALSITRPVLQPSEMYVVRVLPFFSNVRHYASPKTTSEARPKFDIPDYMLENDTSFEGYRANIQPRREYEDKEKGFCRLCQEAAPDYTEHTSFNVFHIVRQSLVQSIMNVNHQYPWVNPEDIIESWWPPIRDCKNFFRIPHLSSELQSERKKKLFKLLRFMKRQGVLKSCFSVMEARGSERGGSGYGITFQASRSTAFERFEWIGDNVMKSLFYNRLAELSTKGKYRISYYQHCILLQGNEPLRDAYDYLSFEKIVLDGIPRDAKFAPPVSKTKADIMEALFGELQAYLWSTHSAIGVDALFHPVSVEIRALYFIALHAMHELCTVMILEMLYSIADKVMPFLHKLRRGKQSVRFLSLDKHTDINKLTRNVGKDICDKVPRAGVAS